MNLMTVSESGPRFSGECCPRG